MKAILLATQSFAPFIFKGNVLNGSTKMRGNDKKKTATN